MRTSPPRTRSSSRSSPYAAVPPPSVSSSSSSSAMPRHNANQRPRPHPSSSTSLSHPSTATRPSSSTPTTPTQPTHSSAATAEPNSDPSYPYFFFYGHAPSNPLSPLSQWADVPFTHDGRTFATAEHWMMFHKALLFEPGAAEGILRAEGPGEAKRLGRKVRGFDAKVSSLGSGCVCTWFGLCSWPLTTGTVLLPLERTAPAPPSSGDSKMPTSHCERLLLNLSGFPFSPPPFPPYSSPTSQDSPRATLTRRYGTPTPTP